MTLSAEQLARDMLERMGIEDAQSLTAGQLVELANLIAARAQPEQGATLALYTGARPDHPEDADEARCIGRSMATANAGTPKDFLNPDWMGGGKVHNWHNYISEEVQSLWMGFSQAQRAALARQAEALADKEEWD